MTIQVVLLGDSVFDNAAYVARGDDVLQQLRNALPQGWRASMVARDGAVIDDIRRQLERLPSDATHLIVSAGGNDALANAAVLAGAASSVSAAVDMLSGVRARFAERFDAMLDELRRLDLPTAICTIYDARFPDPDQRRIASTALAVLNDVIMREAATRGLPLIDLRVLLNEDADFANAIEPSGQGSRKLGRTVIEVIENHDFSIRRSCMFGAQPAQPHRSRTPAPRPF